MSVCIYICFTVFYFCRNFRSQLRDTGRNSDIQVRILREKPEFRVTNRNSEVQVRTPRYKSEFRDISRNSVIEVGISSLNSDFDPEITKT